MSAGADGIHSVEITETGGLQNGIRILDAAEWPEGE
jgi:hypothetical protein